MLMLMLTLMLMMILMGGDGDVNAGTEVLVAMSVIKNAWEMI